jgi:hypothetical protein
MVQKTGYTQKISPAGTYPRGNTGVSLGSSVLGIKIFPTPDLNSVLVAYRTLSPVGTSIHKYTSATDAHVWQRSIPAPDADHSSASLGEGEFLSDGSFIAIIHAYINPPFCSFYAQKV